MIFGADAKQIFQNNPQMFSAVQPYTYRYQRFQFATIVLSNTTAQPLTVQQLPVELLIVSARIANSADVNLWNESGMNGAGIPLMGGDVAVFTVNNNVWEIAEVLTQLLERPNTFPRRAILANQWYVMAVGITQTVDVCFGYGPEQ